MNILKRLIILLIPFLFMASLCADVYAESSEGVKGEVFVADGADLLSDYEEAVLTGIMKPGTEYGNMVFISITDAVGYDSSDYIEMIYQTTDVLAGTDAVIYLIDMDNRMLWISGYGALKKVITPDYGNLITDNVYEFAKEGDYASCACEGYSQIVLKLQGSRVAGSLRTLGNLCIALIIALVVTFLFAYMTSVSKKAADKAILANISRQINMQPGNIVKTRTERIYDPPSSSSSGGGGSRGGGGGGGGFHGGGGGHGF